MANDIDLFFLQRELHTLRIENENLKEENVKLKESLKKTKWHDLREDPNDLPPASKEDDSDSEVVLSDDGDKVYCSLLFGTWYNYHTDRVAEVIAWTELPRFEEE